MSELSKYQKSLCLLLHKTFKQQPNYTSEIQTLNKHHLKLVHVFLSFINKYSIFLVPAEFC